MKITTFIGLLCLAFVTSLIAIDKPVFAVITAGILSLAIFAFMHRIVKAWREQGSKATTRAELPRCTDVGPFGVTCDLEHEHTGDHATRLDAKNNLCWRLIK